MFTDIDYKVAVFKFLVESNTFEGLPSHREAKIQVEKLARMKATFDGKFPPQLVLSLPLKKFKKIHGHDKHLLQQQSTKVDRVCIKVFEEHVKRHLENNQPEKKVTKGDIKKMSQEYIESLNRNTFKAYQNALKDAFKGAAEVLGGSPKEIGEGEQSS
jgi:hypothetical protein